MSDFAEDWVAALTAMPAIHKDQTADAGSYSYKYAGLPSIREAVVPVLAEHNIAFGQDVQTVDGRISVKTRFYHTSGHVEVFGPLELPAGSSPQQAGSATTYARRYALEAALGLASSEDTDAKDVQPEPVREDIDQDPAGWLADAVQVYGLWTPDERRAAHTAAMEALEFKRLSSMDRAEAVFRSMGEAYYKAHPEAEPF